MEIQSIAAARSGYEHWTLRCTKCRDIREAQVPTDPMKSEAWGSADAELVRPT
jgi:hypothetical protein